MIQIEFTEKDAKMLREILRSYLSELREEIAATRRKTSSFEMHEEEDFIKNLMNRLEAAK